MEPLDLLPAGGGHLFSGQTGTRALFRIISRIFAATSRCRARTSIRFNARSLNFNLAAARVQTNEKLYTLYKISYSILISKVNNDY
jgi:hypothetical protein